MVADVQLYQGRSLDIVQQAESLGSTAPTIVLTTTATPPRNAMVETADRLNDAEATPRQYLLLVGGLRTLARGEHAARSVLDSYLLRAMALSAGPVAQRLRALRAPGSHDVFVAQLGGVVCGDCAPVGGPRLPPRLGCSARSSRETGTCRCRTRPRPAAASGLVAAYAQWHLERGIRSLSPWRAGEPEALHAPRCGAVPPARLDRRPSAAFPAVPNHVAIVMDGNGRWANRRGLNASKGTGRARRCCSTSSPARSRRV
jgi:DNA repair protein RecO (recombination protein O)